MGIHRWSRDEAGDLLRQGYSKEHVAGVTGLSIRQLSALRGSKPSLREEVQAMLERAVEPPASRKKATKKAAAKKPAAKRRKKPTAKKVPRKKAAARRPKLEVVKESA